MYLQEATESAAEANVTNMGKTINKIFRTNEICNPNPKFDVTIQ